ncbi:MAG: caspase family protein [Acidobacteriia bacterium]|nr:caspase family protein [Terriglobia bacterium]
MSLRRFLTGCLLSCTALAASAQVCTNQGMRTAAQAQQAVARGNAAEARALLQRAYEECQVSATVLRKIAAVYEEMGDSAQASLFRRQADRFGTPFTLEHEPASPGPGGNSQIEDKSFVREKWALVVGISHFKNPAMNLRFAAKDATDFAAMLTDPKIGRFRNDPQHVKLITDEKATVEGIRTAINEIARDARKEDLVVMYFSSHGTSAGSDVASDEGKSGYIVAYNTDPQNLYATAFPMDELKRVVDTRFKAGRIVAFMDTCYSGGFHGPGGSPGGKALQLGVSTDSIARMAQGKGRVVIASSRDSEQSWESDSYQNSYFTHFLIQAMAKASGTLTVTQIFTELQRSVPKAVLTEKKAAQNPVMSPEGRSIDIVLGTATD